MRVVTPGADRHSQAAHKRRHGMQQPPGLLLSPSGAPTVFS